MYNVLLNSFKGKYYQYVLAPSFIADFSEDPSVHLIELGSRSLDAWFPL